MEILVERIRLGDLIADAVARSAPLAAKSASELVFLDGAAAGELDGDAAKLREILLHLLGNAAKFTHNGRITVGVERSARRDGEWVHIGVRDTGPGISREQVPLLFETFGDAEGSTSSKYGGRGLGLPLSRKLCRLMGGDITVESEPGRGSCFTVHLPAGRAAVAGAGRGDRAPATPELAAAE
jgi:signal transduction histidine kinase